MTQVYVDEEHFAHIVKKELNDTETYEEEQFLWRDLQTLSRWKKILDQMEENASHYEKVWKEEYNKEEKLFQRAGIYKLPDFQLFCEKHNTRMKDLRDRQRRIKERKAKIWRAFNEHKENELLSIVMPLASQEEVKNALDEMQARQQKLLEYQERQTSHTELWGYGYKYGMQQASLCMAELCNLGYAPDDAFTVVRRYIDKCITPWIPYSRGEEAAPIPDFRQFLFEEGLYAGPRDDL